MKNELEKVKVINAKISKYSNMVIWEAYSPKYYRKFHCVKSTEEEIRAEVERFYVKGD